MAGQHFYRVWKQTAKFIRLLHVDQARPQMRFIPSSAAADFVRNFESILSTRLPIQKSQISHRYYLEVYAVKRIEFIT